MNFPVRRRFAHRSSALSLVLLVLACGEDNPGDTGGHGGSSGSDSCVAIRSGPWEFEWSRNGLPLLSFTGGDLAETSCFVTYDSDRIFAGYLEGSYWEGENSSEGFRFRGTFQGNPASSFDGVAKSLDGSDQAEMTGRFTGE